MSCRSVLVSGFRAMEREVQIRMVALWFAPVGCAAGAVCCLAALGVHVRPISNTTKAGWG